MTTVSSKGVFLLQTGTHEQGEPPTRANNKLHHSPNTTSNPPCVSALAEPVEMESMQELIPFAKEMLSQKPSRGLLKVYLVGSMFAVLGTVIGLVETVCHPFSSGEPMDAEMVLMLAQEQRTVKAKTQCSVGGQEEEEEEEEEEKELATTQSMTPSKTHRLSQRSMANRLHAS